VFNMRFPGQRYDSASGLNYNYFRDYEATTGRYVESDPIGLMGGISTYGYVSGNALISVDPTGLIQHKTGRWIDCGKGCRIRIDISIINGIARRHLHWECKGEEGVCGENGTKSHGGKWEDVPDFVKQCALNNGFAGAPARVAPSVNGTEFNVAPSNSTGIQAITIVGGVILFIIGALTGATS